VRIANMGELFPILEAELKKLTTAEVVERGRKHGAPVSPVNDLDAFLDDPQVAHNRTVFEVDEDPGLATMRMLRSPFRLSQDPPSVRRMPPRLGEHTDEILSEAGFSAREIADLRASAAVA
jgi:crotonobetainyl-CoA:carnitine CoA-transferase CaiB-like acyl-CoA transferase